MKVGPEETKTLKIKNQDLTTMTTKMVSGFFSNKFIAPKIPNGLRYNSKKKLYCIC